MAEDAPKNTTENIELIKENELANADHVAYSESYASGMMRGTGYRDDTISVSTSTVSAYVGNLHPSTTKEDLQKIFESCGTIKRIAVPIHATGRIKGCGYVEFVDSEGLQEAVKLHNTTLKGQSIVVFPKRDTVRDMRGIMRGRGRGYDMINPYGRGYPMMNPYGRGMMMPYTGYVGYAGAFMGSRGMTQGYPRYAMPPYGRGSAVAPSYGMPYSYPGSGAFLNEMPQRNENEAGNAGPVATDSESIHSCYQDGV